VDWYIGSKAMDVLQKKIPMKKVPLLVYVFLIFFTSYYGRFRYISCPCFGMIEELLLDLAKQGVYLNLALSSFVAFGQFLFGGYDTTLGLEVEHNVKVQIEMM
jgi:hypothetical protein